MLSGYVHSLAFQYDDDDWSDEGPDKVSIIPQPAPRVGNRSGGL